MIYNTKFFSEVEEEWFKAMLVIGSYNKQGEDFIIYISENSYYNYVTVYNVNLYLPFYINSKLLVLKKRYLK